MCACVYIELEISFFLAGACALACVKLTLTGKRGSFYNVIPIQIFLSNISHYLT